MLDEKKLFVLVDTSGYKRVEGIFDDLKKAENYREIFFLNNELSCYSDFIDSEEPMTFSKYIEGGEDYLFIIPVIHLNSSQTIYCLCDEEFNIDGKDEPANYLTNSRDRVIEYITEYEKSNNDKIGNRILELNSKISLNISCYK